MSRKLPCAVRRLLAPLHHRNDVLLNKRGIHASTGSLDPAAGVFKGTDILCVTQYRDVGIVSGKDKLGAGFYRPDDFYHVVINRLIVQVIFGLIDDHHIIILLVQDKQH